jgi:hypothetical protein
MPVAVYKMVSIIVAACPKKRAQAEQQIQASSNTPTGTESARATISYRF